MAQYARPPSHAPLPGTAFNYLLELTCELVEQTPPGREWPDLVRVRAPRNEDEERILNCWRDAMTAERGAPVEICFDAAPRDAVTKSN